MNYSLGKLVVGIDGSGELFDAVLEELSEGLASTTAEPDVWFDFESELPAIRYHRTGDVSTGDGHVRLNHSGLVIDFEVNEGPTRAKVVPAWWLRPPGLRTTLRRAQDWNYLSPAQTLAKNFMYAVFDWVTHLAQLGKGQSYIHASSMRNGDKGLAILGWGGVGKSTTLLKLCLEDGWKFLSDDLGLIDTNGNLYRTPKRLQVYGYNVQGEPGIEARLLAGRSVLDRAAWEYRLKRFGPQLVRRRVGAEAMFGKDGVARFAPLTRAIFLERSSEDAKGIVEATASDVAARMAAIVLSEIEPYSTLHRQMTAAGLRLLHAPADVQRKTAEVLEAALADVPISFVRVGEQPSPEFVTRIIRSQF